MLGAEGIDMSPLRILAWLVPLVVLAFVALTYGRGGSEPRPHPDQSAVAAVPDDEVGYPRDVRMPEGGSVHLERRPRRVLVANASLLDAVLAIWPPQRLVAIPTQALTWSSVARRPGAFQNLPRFDRFVAEDTLALNPDLVICTSQSSGETIAALRSANVPVVRLPLPERLEDARRDLKLLGEVFGVETAWQEFDDAVQVRIETLFRDVGDRSGRSAIFYVHDGSEGWSSGARTPAEEILRFAGFNNAASAAGHFGSVRISFEELLAMDPEVIVVPAAAGEEDGTTERLLRGESALASLRAVREDRIIALHPSLFATSSIEIVTAAEELAKLADALLLRNSRGGR